MSQDTPDTAADFQSLGRRARKALAVRQALFEAGLAAFERQPIGLVSVLDITEKADVAKGVFYLQFRSKDDYLLALWEEVQGRFLDGLRSAAIDRRSASARIDAAAREFLSFSRQSPATVRFWLRMSSYFPDEIGEPEHLSRIRQEYLQQLACVIVGKTVSALRPRDLQTAVLIDAISWAVINAELHSGGPVLNESRLVKVIRAMLAASGGISSTNSTS